MKVRCWLDAASREAADNGPGEPSNQHAGHLGGSPHFQDRIRAGLLTLQ